MLLFRARVAAAFVRRKRAHFCRHQTYTTKNSRTHHHHHHHHHIIMSDSDEFDDEFVASAHHRKNHQKEEKEEKEVVKYPSECFSLCVLSLAYCYVGCDATKLASRFAFHPPKPSHYELKTTNRGTRYPTISQFHPTYAHKNADARVASKAFASFQCYEIPFLEGEEEKGGEKKKTSSKKNICVFFRPAPRDAKRARLIIHSHGNAMDCGGGFEMLAEIGDQLDVSILSYDYRGYGKSGDVYDQPTAESCAEDLRRVVAWATKARGLVGGQTGDYNRDRFGLDDIVLWGQSIGSGPSTKVATEKEVGGLILECALASGTRVLIGEAKEKHGILSPVRCFRKCEVYDNQGLAVNVKCPALVMHGMKDFEIHHSHGKLIFDKLQARGDSKERFKTYAYWSQTAGHDDVFYDNPRECIRQVQKFVRTLPTTERIQNAIASSSRAEKGLSADDLANPSLLGSERRRENKEKKPYNDKFNRVNQELFYQSPPKKQHMKK